ncbi:cytochrome c biogenesis protein ResB [Citrifermentans bremense]|uniref:cytochrome c biogenesis protein ResB n=1 Tax=Citrifermentans bremense TaxID=60035 RepID=UPI0003F992D2|nr:cytochrome c biogenesis protein ResB [Citrifermentans bremense]
MVVGFIGSKKVAVFILVLVLVIVVYEGVTQQVTAKILIAGAFLLAANLVCCMYVNAGRVAKRSLRQTGFVTFHTGLLVILLGGVVSYYTYSVGYVEVAEGNSFSDERSSYNGWKQRFGSRKGTGVQIGVKKIHLNFWENGQIKEYTSQVVIRDGGMEREAVLEVNGSVRHRGLLINLARYFGLAPHFALETAQGEKEGYIYISDTGKTNTFTIPALGYEATAAYRNITDRAVAVSVCAPGKGWVSRTMVAGDVLDLGKGRLKLTGISLWNGITVVKDSGKEITFAGFALFLAGLLMYYLRFFQEALRSGRD